MSLTSQTKGNVATHLSMATLDKSNVSNNSMCLLFSWFLKCDSPGNYFHHS